MQKIGILGSGVVGQALGSGFIKYGHEVMIGTRDASKLKDWKLNAGDKASVGSFLDTAKFADIIILAAKGTVAKAVLEMAGIENLKDKTIIDATNPIADAPPEHGVLKYFTTLDRSLMEDLQETFQNAHFVKAFNMIGSHLMVNPGFTEKPTMFICGNNEKAKKDVSEILEKFGFETEDLGNVESARAIEPLAMLWCIPGFRDNQWGHAFKLLK